MVLSIDVFLFSRYWIVPYSQENHRHCIETSRPLIRAIDELHAYAMSKEFTSMPAAISSVVRCICS